MGFARIPPILNLIPFFLQSSIPKEQFLSQILTPNTFSLFIREYSNFNLKVKFLSVHLVTHLLQIHFFTHLKNAHNTPSNISLITAKN